MKPQIKPIPFFTSLVIFLGAAMLFLINERVVLPYLDQLGASHLILFLTYIFLLMLQYANAFFPSYTQYI